MILVSPTNEILLLHRVQTSSSFPSAHVFPGGNISPSQDGECPPPEDPKSHDDAIHYRRAAIRELFEESGILLARDRSTGQMVHVDEAERERGRHAIHREEITFQKWLEEQNSAAEPDTGMYDDGFCSCGQYSSLKDGFSDALIPFTHWITPTNLPKRFTTQMYLYFLPVPEESDNKLLLVAQGLPASGREEIQVQVPTSDGGVEIMEARFLPACDWLGKARSGEIILFPPQFLLLHLISQFLDQEPRQGASSEQLKRRRSELLEFIHSGSPPWTHKYICPKSMKLLPDNRSVLALDSPGPELRGSDKKGEEHRVILVRFSKEGPRNLEVRWKKDILRADSKSNL